MMEQGVDQNFVRRLARLRRHWRWITLGTGFAALAGLACSLYLPKVYRATTDVVVSEPKIGTASGNSAWQYYVLMPTYLTFVDNDALIQQAIQHFHLDQPPYRLSLDRFRREHYLEVQIPKSTRLVEINVEFPDAHLAAELANYLALSAVQFNDQMNAAETLATQEFLGKRVEQAGAQLSQAETARLRVQQAARIEDKEKELSILLGEKERLSAQLEKLRISEPEEEARAKSLGQALSNGPRIFELKKSATSDRFLEHATANLAQGKEGAFSVTGESLSGTREDVDRQFVVASSEAEAEQAGMRSITARLVQINDQLGQFLVDVARSRSEVDKAERDFDLAQEAYESASRDLHNVSVTVTAKSQDLKQVAPALLPERPVRPRILLNTILAAALGLILLCTAGLAIEGFREMQQETLRLVPDEESLHVRP